MATRMTGTTHNVLDYLSQCGELRSFCNHGGCIDISSLSFQFVESEPHSALVELEFDEIVPLGRNRIAARQPCFGRLRLFFDESGGVESARVA